MSFDIKLNVFTITLRERNKPKSVFNWTEVVNKHPGRTPEKKLQNMFVDYIKHFDNKFVVYNNWNKGINLGKNAIQYFSAGNYIIGKLEGGPTNIAGTVKTKNNVDDVGFPVTREHVTAMPFYFTMWMPNDSNVGLLIVQSLGELSIYEPLKLNLKKFIEGIDPKFYLDFNEHVVEKAIKKMKEKGNIKQLVIRRSSLPSDAAERVFNKKYNILDNLNIEIRISGFGNSTAAAVKEYFMGNKPDLLEFANMKEVGFDKQSEVLAIISHNGRIATAKLENFSLAPVYFVDTTDVPLTIHNHPQEDKMKSYLKSFLEQMQVEIGYKKS